MAISMSTAGIRLVTGLASVGEDGTLTAPTTWKSIPSIKSIPDLTSAPATLETTTLEETEFKTYINGLKDLGGALEFTANFTKDLIEAIEETLVPAGAGERRVFGVEIPAPLAMRYWWGGTAQPIAPMSAEVDAVLETTVYISMETALYNEAIA